jgi:hypothetical protein
MDIAVAVDTAYIVFSNHNKPGRARDTCRIVYIISSILEQRESAKVQLDKRYLLVIIDLSTRHTQREIDLSDYLRYSSEMNKENYQVVDPYKFTFIEQRNMDRVARVEDHKG